MIISIKIFTKRMFSRTFPTSSFLILQQYLAKTGSMLFTLIASAFNSQYNQVGRSLVLMAHARSLKSSLFSLPYAAQQRWPLVGLIINANWGAINRAHWWQRTRLVVCKLAPPMQANHIFCCLEIFLVCAMLAKLLPHVAEASGTVRNIIWFPAAWFQCILINLFQI